MTHQTEVAGAQRLIPEQEIHVGRMRAVTAGTGQVPSLAGGIGFSLDGMRLTEPRAGKHMAVGRLLAVTHGTQVHDGNRRLSRCKDTWKVKILFGMLIIMMGGEQ